jgi:hypothetical protein
MTLRSQILRGPTEISICRPMGSYSVALLTHRRHWVRTRAQNALLSRMAVLSSRASSRNANSSGNGMVEKLLTRDVRHLRNHGTHAAPVSTDSKIVVRRDAIEFYAVGFFEDL